MLLCFPGEGPAPEKCVPMTLAASLRYGENPHQPAAFYTDQALREHNMGGVATSVQHNGKEMSYNNYLDANAAYAAVCDFAAPTCVIVKHTNPCGVASGDDLLKSYRLAVEADPVSAFGGIVAFNRPVDADLAREIREFRSPTDGETRMFYEIVIAPGYTPEGLEVLKGKSKTLRILEAKARGPDGVELRQILGRTMLCMFVEDVYSCACWNYYIRLGSHRVAPYSSSVWTLSLKSSLCASINVV